MSSDDNLPTVGTRTTIEPQLKAFQDKNSSLRLGGDAEFTQERSHHTKVFAFHNLEKSKQAPIGDIEFTAIRGPHGTIPIRVFFPKSGESARKDSSAGALIYFHGGGYTVGTVDEFENGLRILAENSECQVYGIEYRLAPEWKFPTQLDEYVAVIQWLQGEGGKARGVDPNKIMGGGDSAGGNMTAAVSLRLRDEGKKPLAAQILLYPEARLPFDTKAAFENNSVGYLECNGIFSFADHYLPRGAPPGQAYVSPGMQPISNLKNLPPAAVFTCGFDPLRDVGVEYGTKLRQAGNKVTWHHFDTLTHGFLQFAPWSEDSMKATLKVAEVMKKAVAKVSRELE